MLSVVAGVIYIKDILQGGETRPNAVSVFLWTVLQAIALAAQLKAGASLSVVIVIFVTLNTAIVTVLALSGYGYRKYGWVDFFCLVLAVAAIVGWQVTGNPVLAIGFAIAGDLFACVPTAVKTYKEPRSEHVPAWALITVASVLGVLSTDRLDMANLAFPLYLVVSNGAIFSLAYFGRRISN
ncbi:MAG: hypothetical protein Q8O88_04495 [bacterium]|nr:hypothetical protein [bacterium]